MSGMMIIADAANGDSQHGYKLAAERFV